MGIYDRDYYRDSDRGYLGSLIPEGSVCKYLIGILIAVFVLQALQVVDDSVIALQPAKVMHGEIWRLFTFGFASPDLSMLTLAFSLLFLYWFGSDLEQMYGSGEFLCFYLATILVGGLAFLATCYATGAQETAWLLGALGPITAVTALFAWHFPNHTIRLFMILPVPIWLVVVMEVIGALAFSHEQPERGIYVLAGAVFGSFYYRKQWRISGLFQGWAARTRSAPRTRLRVFRGEEDEPEPVGVAAPKPASPAIDEHLEAKVDAVLEKMARSGKESLSEHERQILLQASEIYRRKRT